MIALIPEVESMGVLPTIIYVHPNCTSKWVGKNDYQGWGVCEHNLTQTWAIYYLAPLCPHSTREAKCPWITSPCVNVNSDKNLEMFGCSPSCQCILICINGYRWLWVRTEETLLCTWAMILWNSSWGPALSCGHWVLDLKTGQGVLPFYWDSTASWLSILDFGCICCSMPLLAAHLSCP